MTPFPAVARLASGPLWRIVVCGAALTAASQLAFASSAGRAPRPELAIVADSPSGANTTTVSGLFSYPVGFSTSLVPTFAGTPITAPLATGTTGIIALRFFIGGPAAGATWQVVYTHPDGVGKSIFDSTFTFDPVGMVGCLETIIRDETGRFIDARSFCTALLSPSGFGVFVAAMIGEPATMSETGPSR